jgi:hypothetical protein
MNIQPANDAGYQSESMTTQAPQSAELLEVIRLVVKGAKR